MKGNVFLDTNIIVYLFDKTDAIKHASAKLFIQECLKKHNGHISTQVVNEFVVVISEKIKNPIPFEEINKRITSLSNMLIISPLVFLTCKKSIEIKQRYKYSYWDSLIISSALLNECSILYTEDMHGGQVIDGKLKIVNPFKITQSERKSPISTQA
ncbi:MAG: PIN domain nuclease [Syntrophus sp. (in: bacteria)]|nr:PIN domain nuclease [Syntrophus sp. (in: bacteria)]